MPMKKAMPGGKIVNKGKYKHGGKVHTADAKKKMMYGDIMSKKKK